MNSFETDIVRAIISWKFLFAVLLLMLILFTQGLDSQLLKMSLPIICTLPYSCGWLSEYSSGFVKYSLSRSCVRGYIWGKFFSCIISGGLVNLTATWLFVLIKGDLETSCEYLLLFMSGMLWSGLSTTLCAASNSKFVAYGSSFVVYYFLVILQERYWTSLYCLSPYEWVAPKHTWIFENNGIVIMLSGFILIIAMAYYTIIRRRLEYV